MSLRWTFADLAILRRSGAFEPGPKTSTIRRKLGYHRRQLGVYECAGCATTGPASDSHVDLGGVRESYESGLADMFASEAVA